MDAPVKELDRIEALLEQGRTLMAAGRFADAVAAADEALGIEPTYLRILTLKAEALEQLGETDTSERLRMQIRQIRREAWQRQVEAEIRGHHDMMGEAIRHELM